MLQCYYQLDYLEREEYIDLVYEVNSLVPKNGLVNLFVSDVPGYLDVVLYIECDPNFKNQLELISKKYRADLFYDKGLTEFMKEMASRQWNSFTFFSDMSYEEIENFYKLLFVFPSKKVIEEQGYKFDKKEYKPKIFISYSWVDKDVVNEMVELLSNNGMNVWVDYRAIDYGEHLLESIQKGINECDLAICFISNNYEKSSMGKHELRTIWSDITTKGKKWKIIKLDDVDPEKIYPGLMQYKYFDLAKEDKKNILDSISKSIKEIKKDKENR